MERLSSLRPHTQLREPNSKSTWTILEGPEVVSGMDTLCVQMSLMVLRHHPRTKGTDNNTNHTLAPTRGKRKGDLTRKPQGETRGTSMSSCNAFSRATAFYSRASCGRSPGPVSKRINLVLGPPPSIPGLMQSEPCHSTQHPNTYTTSLSGRAGSHACVCVADWGVHSPDQN